MRLLHARATLVGQSEVQQLDCEQAKDEHAGVGGEHGRGRGLVEAFGSLDPLLEPFPRESRPPAQVLYQSFHQAGAKQHRAIFAPGGERRAALGEGVRLVQLSPEAKHQPESMKAQGAQRMLRHAFQQ